MKKLKNCGLDLCHVISHPWNPRVWHRDITICRRASIKDNWAKHDKHENIEKKVDIFHNLNGILAKTRNLIFYKKKTNNFVFLSINQMPRNASPARQLYLGEFNFLKCTTLLIPVPIWVRFMAIKMQKVALLEVFHHTAKTKFVEKLADMFDRLAEF